MTEEANSTGNTLARSLVKGVNHQDKVIQRLKEKLTSAEKGYNNQVENYKRMIESATFYCVKCYRPLLNDHMNWFNIRCGHLYCCVAINSTLKIHSTCPAQECDELYLSSDLRIMSTFGRGGHSIVKEVSDLKLTLMRRDEQIQKLIQNQAITEEAMRQVKCKVDAVFLKTLNLEHYQPTGRKGDEPNYYPTNRQYSFASETNEHADMHN